MPGSRYICSRRRLSKANDRVPGREDCRLASASKDTTIKVWDTVQHRPILTLSGHTAAVTCLRWGGKNWIYSGSQDKSIRIWDGKDVQTPQHPNPLFDEGYLTAGQTDTCSLGARALGQHNVVINGLCNPNRRIRSYRPNPRIL